MAVPFKDVYAGTPLAGATKPEAGLFIAFPGTGPIGKTCRDCQHCRVWSATERFSGLQARELTADGRLSEVGYCEPALNHTGKPRRNTNPVDTPACLRFAAAASAGQAEG